MEEENAIVSNIAAIISEEILSEKPNKITKTQSSSLMGYDLKNPKLAFLNSIILQANDDDDEDERFFQQLRAKYTANNYIEDPKVDNEMAGEDLVVVARQTPSKRSAEAEEGQLDLYEGRPSLKRRRGRFSSTDLLNIYDNHVFESHLHLNKISFLQIFRNVRHHLEEKNLDNMSSQSVFSLGMWKLTTDEHFEVISSKFHIPAQQCRKTIRNFWNIISDKYEQFIKWPNSHKMQQRTLEGFWRFPETKLFTNMFGIIVLKRFDVFLEHVDGEVPLIMQVVCNANQEIIDCFVALAKDYSFDDSPIGQTLERIELAVPKKCYLIGDENFPLREYLMRPIEDECFHHEQLYNQCLAKVYRKGYEVLDVIAKRFNMLYALEAKDLKEVRKIVETICALHNLCVETNDDYVARKREVVKFNWGRSNSSQILIKNKIRNDKGGRRRTDLIEEIIH